MDMGFSVVVLDDGVDVRDLATSLDEGCLGLVDNFVRSRIVLEPDNGGLLLVNGEGAGQDGKRGSEIGERSHDDDNKDWFRILEQRW